MGKGAMSVAKKVIWKGYFFVLSSGTVPLKSTG